MLVNGNFEQIWADVRVFIYDMVGCGILMRMPSVAWLLRQFAFTVTRPVALLALVAVKEFLLKSSNYFGSLLAC